MIKVYIRQLKDEWQFKKNSYMCEQFGMFPSLTKLRDN